MAAPGREVFEGWAAIAFYLDVTTRQAQRWEHGTPPLPIHREGAPGGGSRVHAFRDEIDAWHQARQQDPLAPPPPTSPPPPRRWPYRKALYLLPVLAALLLIARIPLPPPLEPPPPGRLFWSVTSESAAPRRVELPQEFGRGAVSPDGARLYVTAQHHKQLYILNAANAAIRTINLPEFPGPVVLAEAAGVAYIGTKSGMLMIVDLAAGRVRETILAGGPVHDLALTPDGRTLFLAMLHSGAKRLRLASREWTVITSVPAPAYTRLDRTSKRLAVSYRNGGPGGRPGHDTVEIFDAETGRRLDTYSGPPNVGGEHEFHPDGETLWIDGGDACSSDRYDHEGCPSTPSRVGYVYRLSDRRLLRTFGLPIDASARPLFLSGGARVLFAGQSAYVYHARTFAPLEARRDGRQWGSAWVAPSGQRAFVLEDNRTVEIIDAEPAACADLGPA